LKDRGNQFSDALTMVAARRPRFLAESRARGSYPDRGLTKVDVRADLLRTSQNGSSESLKSLRKYAASAEAGPVRDLLSVVAAISMCLCIALMGSQKDDEETS
jgi:hypothetical protein